MGVDFKRLAKQRRTEEQKQPNKPIIFRLEMTPSNNTIKGMNSFAYRDLKKIWSDTVFAEAHQAGWRKFFLPYLHLKVTFCNCAYDCDNAIGGFKPIQDAIKDWGMIKDDRKSACKIAYHFDDTGKVPGDHPGKTDWKGVKVELW